LFELITFVANNKMKHLGLFEGIGGFSLAARWMGWETLAWCEWNEFGQKVLKHHFPETEGFGDITKTDFTKYANRIDILTGGFPCQPYSAAGKRLGKEDERHLWPEMLRVIREVQPSWVVGENVLGLVNWSGGLVFHEVQADLEAEGYEVFPFVLPACAVNAPHRRDRVWFVANRNDKKRNGRGCASERTRQETEYRRNGVFGTTSRFSEVGYASNTNGNGFNQCNGQYEINTSKGGEYAFGNANKGNVNGNAADSKGKRTWEQSSKNRRGEDRRFDNYGKVWDAADTNSAGWQQSDQEMEGGSSEQSHSSRFQQDDANTSDEQLQGSKLNRSISSQGKAKAYSGQFSGSICSQWEEFPTQPPICSGDDGLSARLDGITFPKWRNESIKAAGNAIVPQVAFQIFKSIAEYELLQPG
jgi:DNA (cytosine-5)-methyltransferase 1